LAKNGTRDTERNRTGQITMFKDRNGQILDNRTAIKKIGNRFDSYLLDMGLMLLRWVGHIPIHSLRNLCYRLAGIKLGKGAVIHMWANFFQPANISIGEGTIIGDHVFLDGRASLIIGRETDIASSVMIYNSEHDLDSADFAAREEPVRIGDYCFIGPRAIILPGVEIGKGAVVAAGAVVTVNVAEFAIVGGVPAKQIGVRKNQNPSYKLGRAKLFQ